MVILFKSRIAFPTIERDHIFSVFGKIYFFAGFGGGVFSKAKFAAPGVVEPISVFR